MKDKFIKKYVKFSLGAINYLLMPLNMFMKHLMLISKSNIEEPSLFQELNNVLNKSPEEYAYLSSKYDREWIDKKFNEVNKKIDGLTKQEFINLTDLSKVDDNSQFPNTVGYLDGVKHLVGENTAKAVILEKPLKESSTFQRITNIDCGKSLDYDEYNNLTKEVFPLINTTPEIKLSKEKIKKVEDLIQKMIKAKLIDNNLVTIENQKNELLSFSDYLLDVFKKAVNKPKSAARTKVKSKSKK
jgi:hypothetical protein